MTTIKVLYTSTEIIREKFIENTVVTVARLSFCPVRFAEVEGVFFLVSGGDGRKKESHHQVVALFVGVKMASSSVIPICSILYLTVGASTSKYLHI